MRISGLDLRSDYVASQDARARSRVIRNEVIEEFVRHSEGQLESVRPRPRCRRLLRYRKTRLLIAVLLSEVHSDATG